MKQTIFVAILTRGMVADQVANEIIRLVQVGTMHGYDVKTLFSNRLGVDENRNFIVREFLETDATHLIMIDDDNPPKDCNLFELITEDKYLISLPTPILAENNIVKYNVYGKKNKQYRALKSGHGWQMVDRVGAGCIIIKREVLENMKTPFSSILDKDTGCKILGSDLAFSDRCRDEGYGIWVNWDYKCSHYKTFDLTNSGRLDVRI